MKMKKFFRFALMAATVCGLSLAVISCKSDDDNSENNGGGTEAVEDHTSLEEYQLRSIIATFAGMDPADVVLTKTYEPEIGVVDDASKPNVRSIAVGTLERADQTAVTLLSALGISSASPNGFSYSSDLVGTVSYQHGGGSDANTLAIINLGLKQMPGLVQLRLTKTAGENAGTQPHYKVGDIVMYKNHYWVCVFEAHAYKDNAYFVTFDHTGNLHKTSTFTWTLSWSDKYWQHDTPMAEDALLSYWLINCVLNDEDWNKVKDNYKYGMEKAGANVGSGLEEIVPTTDQKRKDLVESIFRSSTNNKDFVTYMVSKEQTNTDYANDKGDVWETYDGDKGMLKVPRELLCNATRYDRHALSNNQYWVPYLFICSNSKSKDFENSLKGISSQNSSKFKYAVINPQVRFRSSALQSLLGTNEISIMTAARYWEHEYFDGKKWLIFDFTRDWRTKSGSKYEEDEIWTSRCVTSKSISIVDKGVKASGFTDIYVARDEEQDNQ